MAFHDKQVFTALFLLSCLITRLKYEQASFYFQRNVLHYACKKHVKCPRFL